MFKGKLITHKVVHHGEMSNILYYIIFILYSYYIHSIKPVRRSPEPRERSAWQLSRSRPGARSRSWRLL